MKRKGRIGQFLTAALISGIFINWSRDFIFASSFMTIDGRRSYSLFDDAMISMRYAWNFSHGNGLVWNAGEYVQGYTNLLMTLLMSVATLVFTKSTAVLSIQILGVAFMLLIAFLAMQIADELFQEADGQSRPFVQMLAFSMGLAYYPLAYWSLMGMETGLLTSLLLSGLLMTFRYAKSGKPKQLLASAILFGLAFLTRNDSIILFLPAWGYLAWEIRQSNTRVRVNQVLAACGLMLAIAIGQTTFQYLYYGQWLPNTYVLKLTGMALLPRIQNGIGFVLPFLKETALILALALASLVFRYQKEKLVLFFVVLLSIIYQIYIGGDAWNYWRVLAPSVPLALILNIDILVPAASSTINALLRGNPRLPNSNSPRNLLIPLFTILFMSVGIISANLRFLPQIVFYAPPYQTRDNETDVNTAIALSEILGKDATIGVLWAGVIPYYTEQKAIDFLGKSDTYIAHLPPDMSGAISWEGMSSVAGHNKYDLSYSIIGLRPTYVQTLCWGGQNISEWANAVYVKVEYHGLSLYLLKNSPAVLWSKLVIP